MKIPPRILVPILLAVGLSVAIGGLFLWQIHSSVDTIESAFQVQQSTGFLDRILPNRTTNTEAVGGQSKALMSLRQGELFELKGEWKHAEEKYGESVAAGGGAPALRKLASIQLQRREYDATKETIAKLKQENKDSDDVLLLEGLLALRSGDAATATVIFKRRPDVPQSMYGLGLIALVAGDHENAKLELTKASESNDTTIRSYADTILQAYQEFALFPDGQEIHLRTLLARSLAQANECETALSLLRPVVLTQSRYRDAWIVKGYCEFTTERLQDALASLEQAYSLDPEKPEIQYFLSRTHAALGDPQNAVTFLQYAILNGFQPERDARELLADYARELGNIELALEQLKVLASKKDSDLRAYERYVDLAINSQNHGLDALAAAKEALARWPDDAGALTLAARSALAAGVPNDAKMYIDAALKIDPKHVGAQEVAEAIRKNEQPTK